jgi:ribosomal protein L11 methyltransferase
MEAGALGTETGTMSLMVDHVTAYFPETPRSRTSAKRTIRSAAHLRTAVVVSARHELREVADRDWLEEWKQNWQPVEIGRFIIAPPWSNVGEIHDRLIIRIEPGMAFGTGTHETTRLCLDAIQKHFTGGSFLDVGTGTGILAIAAAKLFPEARVEACDTDETAVAIARENAAANGVLDQIDFRVGSVDLSRPLLPILFAQI